MKPRIVRKQQVQSNLPQCCSLKNYKVVLTADGLQETTTNKVLFQGSSHRRKQGRSSRTFYPSLNLVSLV
ncbi:hypothetical protein Pelo_6517 [Pelomyxa schiedti]|nr:hypothetical protein Pelo_6517 [Pelomyxa schiedti]